MLNTKYNINIDINKKHTTIKQNLYLEFSEEFIWPDLNNNYYNEHGTCYAIKDHIGILSDGTIVPCCLDTKGIINLGNIYNDNLEEILKSSTLQEMQYNFSQNKKTHELCKHCSFIK